MASALLVPGCLDPNPARPRNARAGDRAAAMARAKVDEIIGNDKVKHAVRVQPNEGRNRLANIERVLCEARHPNVITAYLKRRGLGVSSSALKGHWRCPYFDNDGQLIGVFPAVLAPIIGPDGSLQSVEQIYDAEVEPRKKIIPPVETISGVPSGFMNQKMSSVSPKAPRLHW
jgi:hypothetical protein